MRPIEEKCLGWMEVRVTASWWPLSSRREPKRTSKEPGASSSALPGTQTPFKVRRVGSSPHRRLRLSLRRLTASFLFASRSESRSLGRRPFHPGDRPGRHRRRDGRMLQTQSKKLPHVSVIVGGVIASSPAMRASVGVGVGGWGATYFAV